MSTEVTIVEQPAPQSVMIDGETGLVVETPAESPTDNAVVIAAIEAEAEVQIAQIEADARVAAEENYAEVRVAEIEAQANNESSVEWTISQLSEQVKSLTATVETLLAVQLIAPVSSVSEPVAETIAEEVAEELEATNSIQISTSPETNLTQMEAIDESAPSGEVQGLVLGRKPIIKLV